MSAKDTNREEFQAYMSRAISKGELARRLGISRLTLNKFLRDRKAGEEGKVVSDAEN